MFDDNLLEILGVVEREDVISNLVCHALQELPEFRTQLLRRLDKLPNPDLRSPRGVTRVSVPDVGVPDIVLLGESDRGTEAIVIENKLGAAEGKDQTESYAGERLVEGLRERFDLSEDPHRHLVFLTVLPRQKPKSDDFIHVTYSELLEDFPPPEGSAVGTLLAELRNHVRRARDAEKVEPHQPMKAVINTDAPFDAGFLAFQGVIQGVELPANLKVRGEYRGSARGRRFYGALIRPDRWAPEKMVTDDPPVEDFQPRRHVNIHFEPQANALTGGVTLYLHYEVNPYKTRKWAERNLPQEAYSEYRKLRSDFYRRLRKELPPGWTFRKGSNMLAKTTFDAGATVQEVSDGMRLSIASATPVIDRLLDEGVFSTA